MYCVRKFQTYATENALKERWMWYLSIYILIFYKKIFHFEVDYKSRKLPDWPLTNMDIDMFSWIWFQLGFMNFDLYSIFIKQNGLSFGIKPNLCRIGHLYKMIFHCFNDMLNGKIATFIISVLWYNGNFNIEKEIGAQEWTKSIKLQKI